MMVISTFEHSIEVEEALAVLEKMDIDRDFIMTVIMDIHGEHSHKKVTRHPTKKTLAFEVGMAIATALSVLGVSYGFTLVLGPIIWGLFTAIIGFIGGYGGTRIVQSQYFHQVIRKKERLPEVIVIIRCSEIRFDEVRQVLWQYRALSVGRIDA
jgi:hypothetical protein